MSFGRSRRRITLLLWLCLAAAGIGSGVGAEPLAQTGTPVVADRVDVALEIQANGDVVVREAWQFTFNTSTPIQDGSRRLERDRLVDIVDIRVAEGDRAYTQLRGSDRPAPNTFGLRTRDDGDREVFWFFATVTGRQTKSWTISYRARGAVRLYDQGDQLWWTVARGLSYPVRAANVTVTLPAAYPANQLKLGAYPAGQANSMQARDGRTVVFALKGFESDGFAEARVQFPHGAIAGSPPPWQAAFDEQVWLDEQVRPTVDLLAGLLAFVVLPSVGLLGIFGVWWLRGRDPAPGATPSRLTEPPSRLPAGMVGTLIDERADLHDVLATLADLGQRGVIRVTEIETAPGARRSTAPINLGGIDFEITLLAPPTGEALREYERTFLDHLFGRYDLSPAGASRRPGEPAPSKSIEVGQTVRLSARGERLFAMIPQFATQLENAVAAEGLLNGNPTAVRQRYRRLAGFTMLFATLGGIVVGVALSWLSGSVVLPFITLFILGLILMLVAGKMPARTRAGALEAARWRAFRRFLAELPRGGSSQASELGGKYLAYAVALNLNRAWVNAVLLAGQPPRWFQSRGPLGGPLLESQPIGPSWGSPSSGPVVIVNDPFGRPGYDPRLGEPMLGGGRHHRPREADQAAPSTSGWPGSPQAASDRSARGLDDASGSLARMFDTASDLFAGRSAGGWSGGGDGRTSHGGHGSGGGGGGFGTFAAGAAWGVAAAQSSQSDSRAGGWESSGSSGGGWDSGSSSSGGGWDSGGSSSSSSDSGSSSSSSSES